VIVGIISGKIGAISFKFHFAQRFHNTLNISGKILIFYNIENSVFQFATPLSTYTTKKRRADEERSFRNSNTLSSAWWWYLMHGSTMVVTTIVLVSI
jgi:hypothetical protein